MEILASRILIPKEDIDIIGQSFDRLTDNDVEHTRDFKLKKGQILVWIGIVPAAVTLPEVCRRVPAILDTGCGAEIVIGRKWFEFLTDLPSFTSFGTRRVRTLKGSLECHRVPHFSALLHKNAEGHHLPSTKGEKRRLYLKEV